MKRNLTRSNKNDKISFLKNKNFIKENKNKIVKSSLNLKANQLVLSGKHATLSALQNTKRRLFYLISTKDHYKVWEKNITDLGLSIEVKVKTKEQLDVINNFKPHQNVILIAEHLKRISLDEFLTDKRDTFKKPLR
ncbi:MAG: hypothetical protein ACJZ80_01090 [Candidatus Puniceispirillales bacterium]